MPRIKEIIVGAFDSAAKSPETMAVMEDETWFGWQNWLAIELEGRVVSAMALRPGVTWFAGTPVKCATVGTVCTDAEMRGQGIGNRLMRYAEEVMREGDITLARLHTWAARYAFYGRLGYVKAISNQPMAALDVDAINADFREKAEAELGNGVVRPAHARDAMRMLEIYDATFSRGTGALSRNEHFFLRRIGGHPKMWIWKAPEFTVVDHRDDGVIAYAATLFDGEQNWLVEMASLPHHARIARTLMMHAAREAQRRHVHRMDVFMDSHHPLGWMVHELPMTVESDPHVIFLKVLDEKQFVEDVLPGVAVRADHYETSVALHLAGVGTKVVGAGVNRVELTTDVPHLAALAYNGVWLSGLLGQGEVQIHPDTHGAHEAIRRVFPDTHASRCKLDGF